MPEMMVKLMHPNGFSRLSMPDDMLVAEVIQELIRELSLPIADHDGRQLCYQLGCKDLGRELLYDDTLANAKVPGDSSLILTATALAGGDGYVKAGRISIRSDSGLVLENIPDVEIESLMSNEVALRMTLHLYKKALWEVEQYKQEVTESRSKTWHLKERLKEKSVATVLLVLGQTAIGFGINVITGSVKQKEGWVILILGLAVSLVGLFISRPWSKEK